MGHHAIAAYGKVSGLGWQQMFHVSVSDLGLGWREEYLLTFLRSPKVPILASQCPACPDTPLKRDLPRENALLRRRTHATISSCTGIRTEVSLLLQGPHVVKVTCTPDLQSTRANFRDKAAQGPAMRSWRHLM